MKTFFALPRCPLRLCYALAVLAALLPLASHVRGQSADKFYYWVTANEAAREESFVIEVGGVQKAEIERIFADRGVPGFSGRIAAGSVNYNRNYHAPGQPVWNWHVAAVDSIFDFNRTIFPAVIIPAYYAHPSEIAADPQRWIQQNGPGYGPLIYAIRREVDPAQKTVLANVSNRGFTGAAEKTLIAGFIVKGGEPRNVVVRALGPSLASHGVAQAVPNPKLEVYGGSTRFASNADWQTDRRAQTLRTAYSDLVPQNQREAAMLLTLPPGAYTVHGLSEDGTEGVTLLEVYDVP